MARGFFQWPIFANFPHYNNDHSQREREKEHYFPSHVLALYFFGCVMSLRGIRKELCVIVLQFGEKNMFFCALRKCFDFNIFDTEQFCYCFEQMSYGN